MSNLLEIKSSYDLILSYLNKSLKHVDKYWQTLGINCVLIIEKNLPFCDSNIALIKYNYNFLDVSLVVLAIEPYQQLKK